MSKYRRIAVEVEALQWDSGCALPDWAKDKVALYDDVCIVSSPEGITHARPGDYIIKGIDGGVAHCNKSVFKRTYENA